MYRPSGRINKATEVASRMSRQSAFDPAVRMALTPAGVVKNLALKPKLLLQYYLFYHVFSLLSRYWKYFLTYKNLTIFHRRSVRLTNDLPPCPYKNFLHIYSVKSASINRFPAYPTLFSGSEHEKTA